MVKVFEYLFGLVLILCLIDFISNPKQAIREIEQGPMPHLGRFNASLYRRQTAHRTVPAVSRPLSMEGFSHEQP